MKFCPICKIENCDHQRKFIILGLAKLLIIRRSIEATTLLFNKLVVFLPVDTEIQYKISSSLEDLNKCLVKMDAIKEWCDKKSKGYDNERLSISK